MARSKHLKIYQDVYRFGLQFHQTREKMPKTLKYNLGEDVAHSIRRIIRGIVVANRSQDKVKPLLIVDLEIESLWGDLRMLFDCKGISTGEFKVLCEMLYEISKQERNWLAWAKKAEKGATTQTTRPAGMNTRSQNP